MSASSPEPTSPWQQTDLLGLLAEMDRQAGGTAAGDQACPLASALPEPPPRAARSRRRRAPLVELEEPVGVEQPLAAEEAVALEESVAVAELAPALPDRPEGGQRPPQQSANSLQGAAVPEIPGTPAAAEAEGEPDREPGPAPSATATVPVAVAAPGPVAAAPPPLSPGDGCPARLLILDTETTGLDPARGRCLEVGAILFDVAHRAVLSQVSFLLPVESNPAEHVNGIPAAVSRSPQPWRSGLRCFEELLAACDAVLAHNVAFDRQWFGIEPLPAIEKPWICSMDDIRWPPERHLRSNPSVRDLSLAYGVPVWAAHRALTDCTYLAQVLERCDDLEALLLAAREPRLLFRARLSYAERHRAKEAGFRWNDPVPGAWTRRLSEREAQALPFPVQPVEDPAAAGSHAA